MSKFPKSKGIILHFTLSFCILIFTFCIVSKVDAATLYLEPPTGEYRVGDTFIEEVRINLEPGENINVIEANLKFPQDLLEVIDISFGNSLITIIPQEPIINQEEGIISFAGGIPGGYTGRVSGDPGLSNLLAKIIFRVVSQDVSRGFAQVVFRDDSQVLLNDGLGTPTNLTFKNALINIISKNVEPSKNEWQIELEKDKIPPEPFRPEIKKDPLVFDGQYFLVFSTTDKQTGLDYYEIAEQRGKRMPNDAELEWEVGESPYLLKDQTLQSYIYVKAVDKADNERIEILRPTKISTHFYLYLAISVGLFIILIILYFSFRRRK